MLILEINLFLQKLEFWFWRVFWPKSPFAEALFWLWLFGFGDSVMRHEMLGTDLHSDLADTGELLCLSDKQGEGDSFRLLSLHISKHKHSALSLAGPRPGAWEVCKQVCNGERNLTAPVTLTTATRARRPLPPDSVWPPSALCRALGSGLGLSQSHRGSWLSPELTRARGKSTFSVFSPLSLLQRIVNNITPPYIFCKLYNLFSTATYVAH